MDVHPVNRCSCTSILWMENFCNKCFTSIKLWNHWSLYQSLTSSSLFQRPFIHVTVSRMFPRNITLSHRTEWNLQRSGFTNGKYMYISKYLQWYFRIFLYKCFHAWVMSVIKKSLYLVLYLLIFWQICMEHKSLLWLGLKEIVWTNSYLLHYFTSHLYQYSGSFACTWIWTWIKKASADEIKKAYLIVFNLQAYLTPIFFLKR